jgi:carboxyl-terminal processing protease
VERALARRILVTLIGLLAVMTLETPSTSQSIRSGNLVNADFEKEVGTVPAGWSLADADPATALSIGSAAGEHGLAGRLSSGAAGGSGKLVQSIDAAPWRGRNVLVTARVRVEGDARAGLVLEVGRPKPNETGFHDRGGVPETRGTWSDARLIGYVDDDATTITLGVGLAGRGAVYMDDVRIAEAPLGAEAPSAEAATYLDDAIAFARKQHMRSSEIDWDALMKRAHRQIAGATTPHDTYWAIRAMLGTLGDHHSFFRAPKAAGSAPTASGEDKDAAVPMPTSKLLNGRYGYLSLPELTTFGPDGPEAGSRYAVASRTGLSALDKRRLCGWIIDLRANEGGDMWPMLNGVSALLGRSPYGAFVAPGGSVARWVSTPTGVAVEGTPSKPRPVYAPFVLRQGNLPVAVLTGKWTASSGEAVAIAFVGRPRTRSFGVPTSGYTSGNSTHVMSDGAVLAVASVWERDRTGKNYRDRVLPDERLPENMAVRAAQRWLSARCQ